jgi:hypothetical protein
MIIMPGKNRSIVPITIAVALGFFCAASGAAEKPDSANKPKPSPTPAPTATPRPTPTRSCSLPDNYGVDQTVTREKPLMAVCHNGKILCLPAPAASAHIQHGDTPLGPCTKQGNLGPCTP